MCGSIYHLSRRQACMGLLGTAMLAALAARPARAANSFSFAVVPQFERRRLVEIWKPIIDAVAVRTGLDLRLTTTLSVVDFERQLGAGAFDFVFTNPYHILMQRDRQGYVPLVRDRAPLRGIVLVAKDSPITSPRQLDGKVLAVPSANAIGASILIRADLERLFGVHVVLRDVRTHASVYLHVANNLVDAGGGVQKVLDEQDADVRERVRVLYTTRELPSHPVAAHPRVPVAVREAVRRAFLDLQATEDGARLLAQVPMRPAIATSMADYLPMAEWGLEHYWTEEGPRP
jgi:phosphonate transport system substrate-binding protein